MIEYFDSFISDCLTPDNDSSSDNSNEEMYEMENLWRENAKAWEQNQKAWQENEMAWEQNQASWQRNNKFWKQNEAYWTENNKNIREIKNSIQDLANAIEVDGVLNMQESENDIKAMSCNPCSYKNRYNENNIKTVGETTCNQCVINNSGLAHAYVPFQENADSENPCVSLLQGTAFNDLLIPFKG